MVWKKRLFSILRHFAARSDLGCSDVMGKCIVVLTAGTREEVQKGESLKTSTSVLQFSKAYRAIKPLATAARYLEFCINPHRLVVLW